MKYNNIKVALLLATVLFALSSCTKWLEVQPEDKLTEVQLFTSEAGVRSALNGQYIEWAESPLYGNQLTMGTMEVLAQRYNIGTQHNRRQWFSYNYADVGVASTIESIWNSAYVSIVNINAFVAGLDKYKGNLAGKTDSLFRGEAIAMRAMMHFDVLRMFGPMYSTADSVLPSIPYYTKASTTINPLLNANVVMDSILADVKSSLGYLSNDPVRANGPMRIAVGDGNDFWRNRHQRLNYFAVKALEARIQLYRGNKPAALEAANAVIDQIGGYFPWVTSAAVLSNKDNPNRVFSNELLFGLFSIRMYETYRSIFAPEIADAQILAPNDTRLKNTFEANENDYRYNPSWVLPNVGSKSYKTFFKFADVVRTDSSFRYLIPLIRKSEMYYIAAECSTDPVKQLEYINTVRFNRGLTALPATANVTTELEKEYGKEFYGEGQMWFYYKRKNFTRILNGTTTTTTSYVNLSKLQYVFPLPLDETRFR